MSAKVYGRQAEGDDYSTPHWAVLALLDVERFPGPVLEPACGQGNIVRALASRGYEVIAADVRSISRIQLHDQWGSWSNEVDDPSGRWPIIKPATCGFFQATSLQPHVPTRAQSMVTNPPYGNDGCQLFVERGLELGLEKIAIFTQHTWDGGGGRYSFFTETPYQRKYIFPQRISCYPEGDPREGEYASGGGIAYAWYVWDATTSIPGSGNYWFPDDLKPRGPHMVRCPACKGEGHLGSGAGPGNCPECPNCSGTGFRTVNGGR